MIDDSRQQAVEAALDMLLTKGTHTRTTPGYGGVPPIQGEVFTRKKKRYSHPLNIMLVRDHISYGLWYGGLRFHADYELANVSGESTVNWDRITNLSVAGRSTCQSTMYRTGRSRAYVSGHYVARPRADANATLHKLHRRVGDIGYKLLCAVCAHGITLNEVHVAVGGSKSVLSRYFHEALEKVADHYSLAIDSREKS